MADRTIGGLPPVAELYDDSLLAVEQQGEACRMTRAQWKGYAKAGVEAYVEGARDAAAAAAGSAGAAAGSAREAAQSAAEAAGSALSAREYAGRPPAIRDGYWWVWDAESGQYKPTGEAARGNLMFATFFLDPATGDLYMAADKEYAGPGFRLSGGDLEVVLNYGN